ncbi:hypothetical protein B9Z55_029069 [Caenorhabditis nigoni]|uniref:6-phosphofructokinase n=1 Tax=Caenorhabditis nigoni TaxID=1611254 RepID=A0A2G5S986_9PELO|nr:hypothetical protein B9Z55_029069 [Caenorhabditis nigoni]
MQQAPKSVLEITSRYPSHYTEDRYSAWRRRPFVGILTGENGCLYFVSNFQETCTILLFDRTSQTFLVKFDQVVALDSEADFCFIPEWPASENWRDVLCDKISLMRSEGQRNTIFVAEGAINRDGKLVTAEDVKTAVKNMYDTRVAILGHVQRGGASISF